VPAVVLGVDAAELVGRVLLDGTAEVVVAAWVVVVPCSAPAGRDDGAAGAGSV
jgi:hypothetical protein